MVECSERLHTTETIDTGSILDLVKVKTEMLIFTASAFFILQMLICLAVIMEYSKRPFLTKEEQCLSRYSSIKLKTN